MKLIAVLDANNIEVSRQDVRDAVSASNDMFLGNQQSLMKPQLLFAVNWACSNIQDQVLRMGWAATGYRLLGAPELGMFCLTDKELLFIRKDQRGEDVIHRHARSEVSDLSTSGWFALKKLTFSVKGEKEPITWHRIHKDNAAFLIQELSK